MSNRDLYRDDAPDIETSSADYASRFQGPAGEYLLDVQAHAVTRALERYAGCSLLELGGGHGQLLGVYRSLSIDYTLHGSHEACFADLPTPDPDETRIVSDLRALPLEDKSIDVALAVRLISHLEDWPMVLAEMCRVARRAVVIDYPSLRSINALTPLLFALKKKIEKNTRTYLSFHRGQLASVLSASAFGSITEYRQFVLPMGVHRASNGHALTRAAERIARTLGLTALIGSPVILVARATGESQHANRQG